MRIYTPGSTSPECSRRRMEKMVACKWDGWMREALTFGEMRPKWSVSPQRLAKKRTLSSPRFPRQCNRPGSSEYVPLLLEYARMTTRSVGGLERFGNMTDNAAGTSEHVTIMNEVEDNQEKGKELMFLPRTLVVGDQTFPRREDTTSYSHYTNISIPGKTIIMSQASSREMSRSPSNSSQSTDITEPSSEGDLDSKIPGIKSTFRRWRPSYHLQAPSGWMNVGRADRLRGRNVLTSLRIHALLTTIR